MCLFHMYAALGLLACVPDVVFANKLMTCVHATSAKIESHGGRLDISKTHISHDGLDDPTKVAQETFQDHLHSEASKHEEKHDSLSVASGSSARVIEAFTMLHESPEAQVIKLQLILKVSRQGHPNDVLWSHDFFISSC